LIIQSVSRMPAARLKRTQRPLRAAGTRIWIRLSVIYLVEAIEGEFRCLIAIFDDAPKIEVGDQSMAVFSVRIPQPGVTLAAPIQDKINAGMPRIEAIDLGR